MNINYIVNGTKRESVPIYVRFSHTREIDLRVKSGLFVDAERWSNRTQTIKQRITTESDNKLIEDLAALKKHIKNEFGNYHGSLTKEWLTSVINRFHNIKDDKADTLNGFIKSFIDSARSGDLKNKGAVNFAEGTVRAFEGFQRIFNEYQGIYIPKRIAELKKQKKQLRERKNVDFEDVTIDFYRDFVAFLSNEGYKVNTTGRFIKELKYIMRKALSEGKHKNRQFMEGAFSGFSEDSHAIYLTTDEVEKIYNFDLKTYPRMELARDAFIVLCETALRISDYKQIDINIRERNGKKYIHIYQSKTNDVVIIPLTVRMDAILTKYDGKLPRIPEQHVNRDIKVIAKWCGITEEIHWPAQKFGKKYTASAKKFELITNHTGRRTACTNMYLAGIPTIDIMKISGHRTEKSFLTYIRITAEETAERLSEHPYYSGLKVVS